MNKHVEFLQDVMRHYRRHQVEMLSVQPSDGDIIHIALRLQFADRVFLRSSAIMKVEDLLHGSQLVRHNHLELEIRIAEEQRDQAEQVPWTAV